MIFGENQYGSYCVPESSAHRPAAKAILAGQVHEPDTIDLIVERADGQGAIVHAGTYFGDFLPALHKVGVQVHAFEPNPENWLHAIGTLHVNKIVGLDVARVALGEANYAAKVVNVETRRGRPFILGGGSFVNTAGDQDCVVRTLDSIVGDQKVAVIHLDVEGYEEKALIGALHILERWKPMLILETVPPMWRADVLPLGYKRVGKVHTNTVFEAKGGT